VPKLLLAVILKQLEAGAFALRKMHSVPRFDYRFIFTVPQNFFICDSTKLLYNII